MKKILVCILLAAVLSGAAQDAPRNMILFLVNGLDASSVSLARMALQGPYGSLAHEKIEQGGYLSTFSFSSWVPDAASALSCIATGERANNGELGLDSLGTVRENILEKAKRSGKAIGLVTDTRLTYASCAAFYAHSTNRYQENSFALDLLNLQPDIVMGGGKFNFLPTSLGGMRNDGQDLLNTAVSKGYRILRNRMDLIKCSTITTRVLGVFAENHLCYEIDRPADEPSFYLLVDKALKLIAGKSDNGFVLAVVCDRLSQALRNHDVKAFLSQFEVINRTCKELISYQRLHPDTLFLFASAFSTSPPFLSEKTELSYLPNLKASAEYMAAKIDTSGENVGWVFSRYAGFENLSEKEKSFVFYDLKNEFLPLAIGDVTARRMGIYFLPPSVQKNLAQTLGNTSCVTPFFVSGKGADRFRFTMGNYEMGKILNSMVEEP